MIHFTKNTPTIVQVFNYTWNKFHTRFDNKERDVLITKVQIINKKQYVKQSNGQYTPTELLEIVSTSSPQYGNYLKVKGKESIRQMKIKHTYDIYMAIQKDEKGEYNYNTSKIIWRTGSFKKMVDRPPQKDIKTVYRTTHAKLKNKYTDKKTGKVDMQAVKREEALIRKNGKYVDVGDWNAQKKGIMGDCYERDYFIQKQFDCLYGPLVFDGTPDKDVKYPFFDKHILAVLEVLFNKKIIKVK